MGGKAACLLALTSPELLHKACIVDISPTVYAPDKLEAICEAMSLLNLDLLRTRAEAFEQLDDAIPVSHLTFKVCQFHNTKSLKLHVECLYDVSESCSHRTPVSVTSSCLIWCSTVRTGGSGGLT